MPAPVPAAEKIDRAFLALDYPVVERYQRGAHKLELLVAGIGARDRGHVQPLRPEVFSHAAPGLVGVVCQRRIAIDSSPELSSELARLRADIGEITIDPATLCAEVIRIYLTTGDQIVVPIALGPEPPHRFVAAMIVITILARTRTFPIGYFRMTDGDLRGPILAPRCVVGAAVRADSKCTWHGVDLEAEQGIVVADADKTA